ncbi:MAG: NAD(P)/FAD-dependent oxidoreductase [Candidatus Omnitrophica bacterium]|nr:NAD(P)/FAD-dependent oxidoreductase [Candidatus Omnitrophota bacterium]
MEIYDVVVIGGGPAGCMAAIKAGEAGKKVLLLEKNKEIGEKLLLTGNKRGNITNLEDIEEFLTKYRNGQFLRNGFAQFFNEDLIEFFESSGLRLKVERGQRVYPESDNAGDIVKLLKKLLKKSRVQVTFGKTIKSITRNNDFFELSTSGKNFAGRKVIIACGGKSFPGTGSDGVGYILARKAGHTIAKPVPALCGIEVVRTDFAAKCRGITLKNVRISAFLRGKKIGEEFGEVLFTHYGLSGPAVLNMSGDVSEHLGEGEIKLEINFKPALTRDKLDGRLLRELKENSNKHLKNMFKNLLPVGLIPHFLQYAGIDGEKRANQITKEDREKMTDALMHFTMQVKGTRKFAESMVTRGGVSVKEINPKTMESKIVPGLFFAGEVIDVDGKTGGYNLQAAFTTGYVAGTSI